ncbi:MAG: UPF0280 family protein [Deltaproteobacteria bacterium]|nr:UPF0280 family protein [Candidatus Anaeroferrophillacea bacterium]
MGETDLHIWTSTVGLRDLALARVVLSRRQVEAFLDRYPEVRFQLDPFVVPDEGLLPAMIRDMIAATRTAGVGPMAAVAGAIAEAVGRELLEHADRVIVENGGDIFMAGQKEYLVGIHAGPSVLSDRVAVRLRRDEPFAAGICTSSASVGHSLSFGCADAAVIYADNSVLADALATATANRVGRPGDLQPAVREALTVPGVRGAVIIIGRDLAAGGELELVSLGPRQPG